MILDVEVLQGIVWYCRVLCGIAWYCVVLQDIEVLQGIVWYCRVLCGIAAGDSSRGSEYPSVPAP